MISATLMMLLRTIKTKLNTGTHTAGDVIAASNDVNKHESERAVQLFSLDGFIFNWPQSDEKHKYHLEIRQDASNQSDEKI